jgi:outer membrane biogenesis lipoprotein LolB
MSNKPLIILSALACLSLVGCSEKGPAEQAGEKVDQAVEQAKDAVEDAGQQGPAEEAGEKIDQTVEDMKKDDAAE